MQGSYGRGVQVLLDIFFKLRRREGWLGWRVRGGDAWMILAYQAKQSSNPTIQLKRSIGSRKPRDCFTCRMGAEILLSSASLVVHSYHGFVRYDKAGRCAPFLCFVLVRSCTEGTCCRKRRSKRQDRLRTPSRGLPARWVFEGPTDDNDDDGDVTDIEGL